MIKERKMAKEDYQPCKCPTTCNLHGDCTACRDYHLKENSETYCAKSSYEKKFDREQTHLKKITSVPAIKIPKVNVDPFKSVSSFQNLFKGIANPSGLLGLSGQLKEITSATEKFYKAFLPDFQNILNIGSSIVNVFEEQMKNEYNFKQEIILKWNNLETELKTENRYFPKSDLLSILESCIKEAKYNLTKGKYLYRARKFNLDDLSKDIKCILEKVTDRFNDYQYQKLSDKEKDIWDYIINIPYVEWEQDYINELKIPKIFFWGYNSKKSEAPPNSKTIPGRANPVGISYLYTADSIDTAISEIHPTIDQLISVAKIKTLKELNLFNFNFYETFKNSELIEKSLVEIKEQTGISFEEMKVFFDTVSELYSKPSFGYTDNYYATQYISEYIKNHGFDGIAFNSSLKKGGINYVLFDTSKDDKDRPNNYKIVRSSLHKIGNVKISTKRIFPKRSKSNSKQ